MLPAKGSAFAFPPDTTDGHVYADEFVHYLESQFPNAQTDPARRIFYMLDNEPDLWSSTHPEIHPAAPTYAEMAQKSADLSGGLAQADVLGVFGRQGLFAASMWEVSPRSSTTPCLPGA